MAVKIVRMLSGEDVLCDCEENDNNYVSRYNNYTIFEHIVVVVFFTITPYIFTTKDPLNINKEMVVFVGEPDNSLLNQHKKMFGGILTPDSMLVN